MNLASAFATSFTIDAAAFGRQLAAMLGDRSCALLVATIDGELVG